MQVPLTVTVQVHFVVIRCIPIFSSTLHCRTTVVMRASVARPSSVRKTLFFSETVKLIQMPNFGKNYLFTFFSECYNYIIFYSIFDFFFFFVNLTRVHVGVNISNDISPENAHQTPPPPQKKKQQKKTNKQNNNNNNNNKKQTKKKKTADRRVKRR